MPIPRGRDAQALENLVEYLVTECQPYEPVEWDHYSQVHDPTLPPKGFIETTKGKPTNQQNFDLLGQITYYSLNLIVSNESFYEAVLLVNDWRSVLTQKIMRKLQKDGYEGFFKGIELVSWEVNSLKNQDDGGTVILTMLYEWNDHGVNTGLVAGNVFT